MSLDLASLSRYVRGMATELGGSQISSLMETLPGIANVLRSPVADALSAVIRAAARLAELHVADVEELMKYASRRGLMAEDEAAKLLAEVLAAQQRKAEREQARAAAHAAKPAKTAARPAPEAKAKAVKAPKPAARPPVRAKAKPVVKKPVAKKTVKKR